MFRFLKKIKINKRTSADKYEDEKTRATSGDVRQRLNLAKNTRTNQEILYYLAEHDPDPRVRRAVAKNAALPVQAGPVLAADKDVDVRIALAERLVTLLPDLPVDKQSQLYAFAVQAVGMLALDEVLKIRLALSSTLKDYAHAPPKIAAQLARDVERAVSEPILRYCAALPDDDLLDILKNHPAPWAVQAIASRASVSGPVSRAVIDVEDIPAGTILIGNKGAVIEQTLLEIIIDKARHYPEWQKPAAVHKNLSSSMATKLAEFADSSVRDILLERSDFDPASIESISVIFRRRLDYAAASPLEANKNRSAETPVKRALRLEKEGALTEDVITDALALRDREFVVAALARRAKTTVPMVEKIVGLKAAKPFVSLCWRAGLGMRLALQLQQELVKIPPSELLYPRGGTDYPLSEDDMIWQLDFVGLKAG